MYVGCSGLVKVTSAAVDKYRDSDSWILPEQIFLLPTKNKKEHILARLGNVNPRPTLPAIRARMLSFYTTWDLLQDITVELSFEMSIYDFMTHPSWGDAKVFEESHHHSSSLLESVPSHTTAPTAEGTMILLPTPDEIVASLSDPRLTKKAKGPLQVRVRSASDTALEPSRPSKKRNVKKRTSEPGSSAPDEGISTRAVLVPTPRVGKRLGAPPSMVVVSASGPSHVGTSFPASTSGRSFSLGGAAVSGRVGKSEAEVMRRQLNPLDSLARSALACDAEYDQISVDDFGTATRGEEIDLTLFPLALGLYHMPYPYEGVSSPLNTKEEWDGPHAPESNILCKDIFKDPNVCRKALNRTITPGKLRRTESLLPFELSKRVNVLSALLVS
ncbi:hypothetical protein Tco_0991712 [Tanacetum coccineum]|uniref:Uncharacterized protein n=1 Tax=Tanacetum coccineum TaxID=301880 RepID=A0ABQ5F0T1_9ASTR